MAAPGAPGPDFGRAHPILTVSCACAPPANNALASAAANIVVPNLIVRPPDREPSALLLQCDVLIHTAGHAPQCQSDTKLSQLSRSRTFGYRFPEISRYAALSRYAAPGHSFGAARRYCSGRATSAPSSFAAIHAQCGSSSIARPSATMSALPLATISSACREVTIRPTTLVAIPVSRLICSAIGTL